MQIKKSYPFLTNTKKKNKTKVLLVLWSRLSIIVIFLLSIVSMSLALFPFTLHPDRRGDGLHMLRRLPPLRWSYESIYRFSDRSYVAQPARGYADRKVSIFTLPSPIRYVLPSPPPFGQAAAAQFAAPPQPVQASNNI